MDRQKYKEPSNSTDTQTQNLILAANEMAWSILLSCANLPNAVAPIKRNHCRVTLLCM